MRRPVSFVTGALLLFIIGAVPSRSFSQDLLFDASKARSMLEWAPSDHWATLRASVTWHLANPPPDTADFRDDDAALQRSLGSNKE